MTAFATSIEAELERRGTPAGLNAARYGELLRIAAYSQMNVIFERAASQIFASQLELLKLARSRGNSVDGYRGRDLYDKARADFPDAYTNLSYERWIGFLESFELISRDENGVISLTERGIQFLIFFPASAHLEPTRL